MNLTKQGFLQEDGRVVKETTKKYIKKGIMARLISFVLYSLPHFKKGLEVGILTSVLILPMEYIVLSSL